MKYTRLLIILLLGVSAYSQYTEVINSRRPGFSESPYAIGTNVYQIESGIFYKKNEKSEIFTRSKSMGADLHLRYGFLWEKLELNANFRFQKDHILENTVLGTTRTGSGISQFTVGAKFLIYKPKYKDPSKEIRSWKKKFAFDWSRLVPSFGIYAGLNTNFLSANHKAPSFSPKAIIMMQNDFSDYLILVNNFVGDYLTIPENRTIGYISTLTYSITDRVTIFGETQGMFSRYTKEYQFGGGFAYLLSKDIQLDIFARQEIQFDYLNLYGGLGVSWRLDRHKDKAIYKDTNAKKGSGKVKSKKDNFFNRLFSKKKKRRR